MRVTARMLLVLALAGIPVAAEAQASRAPARSGREVDSTGSLGRAPWQPAWQYDTGSDNDRHPERPYYQQGGGMQTGGPARNLIPDDHGQFVPRE